jgi:hypothetical protein
LRFNGIGESPSATIRIVYTTCYPVDIMANPRCVHGLDTRFCSICNKPQAIGGGVRRHSPASFSEANLDEVIRFLNDERIRATYGAVAGLLGVLPRGLGSHLGFRRPEVSWIVNAETGVPTDYNRQEIHPDLFSKAEIIRTGSELVLRMAAWKAKRR